MTRSAPGWVVAIAVVASACATAGRVSFSEPTVELTAINVTGFGLSGGTLDLVFDVFNPNDYRIRSTRIEIGLDLNNQHFGDALIERPLDLSPTNHTQVVVPVRFEWAGVGAGAKALLRRHAIGYEVAGAVLLAAPMGDRRVIVRGTGEVPLSALVK